MTTFISKETQTNSISTDISPGSLNGINWLMTSSYREIRPGDQVFIWRARGSSGAYKSAGIVAECVVLSPAIEMPDDPNGAQFWVEKADDSITYRVWLKITRVAVKGTLLDQEQIRSRLGLSKVGPLGYRSGTNYKLSPPEAVEINELWDRFLDQESLERLKFKFDAEADAFEKLPLADLIEQYHRSRMPNSTNPSRSRVTTSVFQRDPLVKAIARVRAGFCCEVPHCPTPSFPSLSDEPYCEVHHLLRLADGGKDAIDNVVCVCANHHRELHIGRRREELTTLLRSIRS